MAQSGLGPPTSIFNQENVSKICPQANLTKAIPKLRRPQMTLGCVGLAAETDEKADSILLHLISLFILVVVSVSLLFIHSGF